MKAVTLSRTMRNRLFEEQSVLIDRTIYRYSNMIRACHLCREDVRQELALQMLLLLERYDPSRCPNMDAYLMRYLRYALLRMTLPGNRYGISSMPEGQKVQMVPLDECHQVLSNQGNPYTAIELLEEINALPATQQAAIRRLLYGERLHCTNKALVTSRRRLRWFTGAPGTRYRLKKECETYGKTEGRACGSG